MRSRYLKTNRHAATPELSNIMLSFLPVPFYAVKPMKSAFKMAARGGKPIRTALPILSLTSGMRGSLRHFVPNMQIVG